jgi:ATP-dependent DNA helicase RecQ
LQGVDKDLYDILRELRKRIAAKEDIQAYIVCKNEAILQMAKKKPTNYDSMMNIKGIGKKFMDKYGDLFLNVIIKYEY